MSSHASCRAGTRRADRRRERTLARRVRWLAALVGLAAGIGAAHADSAPPGAQIVKDSCPAPEYPLDAAINGENGSMLLRIQIAADGHAQRIDIQESSGYARLDAAAVEALQRCRFVAPLVDGVPVAGSGVLRFTFKQQERAGGELESVTQTLHLRKFVDVISKRCALRAAEDAGPLSAALSEWHRRNDALARRINDYKQQYYERIGRTAMGDSGVRAQRAAETSLQASTSQTALLAASVFDRADAAEQRAYCARFVERLNSGRLDLDSLVIKFPELERALAAPAP